MRKGHTLLQNNIGIFQVPISFKVDKLCSDKIKIFLDIGLVLLVSKPWTICKASTAWPTTTDQTVLVNILHDLYSMFSELHNNPHYPTLVLNLN